MNVDAGVTRGRVPDPEESTKRLLQELEQIRKQLAKRDRQLAQLRNEASGDFTLPEDKNLRFEVASVLNLIPVDFGGGCTLGKACVLASLIREYNLTTTVDIGVYRGRSLFPQALAHKRYASGVAYGVDPWSASEAREYDNLPLKREIDRWAEETDFETVYQSVRALSNALGYKNHCVLLRKTSADAIAYFRERDVLFSLVHIDGNHDTEKVSQDVELYLPRVEKGGFVIMDDVTWESVRPAYKAVASKLTHLFERQGENEDYAVFWKGRSLSEAKQKRELIAQAAHA